MLILADRRRNPGRLPASRAGCCQPEDSQSATGSLFSRSRLGNSIPRDHEELGLGGGKSCGRLLPRSSRAANDGRTVLRTFPSWAVNCLMLGQRNSGTSSSNTMRAALNRSPYFHGPQALGLSLVNNDYSIRGCQAEAAWPDETRVCRSK